MSTVGVWLKTSQGAMPLVQNECKRLMFNNSSCTAPVLNSVNLSSDIYYSAEPTRRLNTSAVSSVVFHNSNLKLTLSLKFVHDMYNLRRRDEREEYEK